MQAPFLISDLTLQLGMCLARPWFVDLVIGTQPSVKNVGFDEIANADADTTERRWTFYAGVGVDLRIDWLFAVGHVYMVFEDKERVAHGLRATLQLGYAF